MKNVGLTPVSDFFSRFLANPNSMALREFQIDLLDLEVSRADFNMFCEQPLVEASDDYKKDIDRADRVLSISVRSQRLNQDQLDLQYSWLTLLGHRLSVERDLLVSGVDALSHVASIQLDLPLKVTEVWSECTLFEKYTCTKLKDEWDYLGMQFRMFRRD